LRDLKNIVWHDTSLSKDDRKKMLNQEPFVLWFTGLSASGKSTLANNVEKKLFQFKYHTYLLDGDNVRHGLNKDLGFDEDSRVENIRRVGEVSKILLDSGLIVVTAFISPFISDRKIVKDLFENNTFFEIYIDSSVEVCEKRDPKGLYKKARSGEIKNFTGISSPYEPPKNPDLHILNDNLTIEEATNQIIKFLLENNLINKER